MAQNKTSFKNVATSQKSSDILGRIVRKQWFSKTYVVLSLLILFGTTVFWSLLSARVHSGNADQLVNPYLFDNASVMRGALLPGQHTFLLKWPIFIITKLYGESTTSYEVATVALSLITVGSLAYVIHRIDRRPIVKGTLFIALASVLFVIPAQPYPGGLLPVNMAMIATRNIEYIVYIICAWAIVRTKRYRSNTWIGACLGLALLITTDKLFLTLSLGSALVACVAYTLRKRWRLAIFTAQWFITALVGTIGSFVILAIINASRITQIAGQGSAPYKFISNSRQLTHGILGAVVGLLSNFGANPAFNTIKLHDTARQIVHHVFSFGGPILVINGLLLVGALAASLQLIGKTFKNRNLKKTDNQISQSQKLALIMLWTTAAAYGAYITTDHFYPVDARYLTIGLFAFFITMASFVRTKEWDARRLLLLAIIMIGAIALSVPMVLGNYRSERDASFVADSRNKLITQAITSHKVNLLVGDYWRVVPIKQMGGKPIAIMPLEDCTTPRGVLSSTVWQPDLQSNSFAYILSLDKSQTNYPTCSANVVYKNYGKPNASVVIDGSIDNPKELLLFYDHGAQKSAPTNGSMSPIAPTVEAIPLQNLPIGVCSVPTSLNIVAHQDDDLLFMNPDVQKDISAGRCVRTIYMTAGDAGANQFYWLGREQGSESAYSRMTGNDTVWIQRIVKLRDNQYITIANPKGNIKISLIFIRLPDGNIHGQGYDASKRESLQKLYSGAIPSIQSVYGNSVYTAESLTTALTEIMHAYQPAEIRTMATLASTQYPDHSDHMAVSRFTERAYLQYELNQYNNSVTIPIKHYIGYPIHAMSENVFDNELDDKTSVFLSYAKHDGGVCQSVESCASNTAYGFYLRRQYTQ